MLGLVGFPSSLSTEVPNLHQVSETWALLSYQPLKLRTQLSLLVY